MSGPQPITAFLEQYAAHSQRWAESIHLDSPPDAESRARLDHDLPWIDATSVAAEPATARMILGELLADLRSSAASNRYVLDRLTTALDSGDLSAEDLLRATLVRDGPAVDRLAERIGVPTQVLHFVGVFFARPFLSSAARGFDPRFVEIEATRGDCPVCGAEPALALLMPDDGQRRLWCRLCATQWPVRRLRCLSCGNADSGTLGYFYMGEEAGRRIDYCEKCRRYIRTIDLRTLGCDQVEVLADREGLSYFDLDAAAAREGLIPLTAENDSAEWRRAGMGSDRKRGGQS